MTPAEYLTFERASQERHEYADGETVVRSGGTREHSLASQNIAGELGNALLERPCEVHGPDMKIKTRAGKYHYADAFVLCGSPIFEDETPDVVENPKLIVEVLSDSTERYDRGDKLTSYRTLDTLEDYILVSRRRSSSSTITACRTVRGCTALWGPGSGSCSRRSDAKSRSNASI